MQDDIYLLNEDKAGFSKQYPEPLPDIKTQTLSFNYLGGNKKGFLVIVHYPEFQFIADNHLEALQNIFKRLALGLDDIAILNLANYSGTSFEDLMEFFNPQKLLLLGEKAIPDGVEKPTLNMPAQLNNCNSLFSFSFEEMMDNLENKKAFWEKMKQF